MTDIVCSYEMLIYHGTAEMPCYCYRQRVLSCRISEWHIGQLWRISAVGSRGCVIFVSVVLVVVKLF
jgi:hypothetical protein